MRLATTIILFILSLAWLAPSTEVLAASVAQISTTQTTVITKTVTTQTVTTQTVTTQTVTSLPEVEVAPGNIDPLAPQIVPIMPVDQCADLSTEGFLFPSVGDNGLYGYVNHLGDFVLEPQFILASEFSEGLAAVSVDGTTFGYIDALGNVVISPQFSDAGAFSEGLAAVRSDDPLDEWLLELGGSSAFIQLSGYINCEGAFVIEPQYPLAAPFHNGIARVFTQNYAYVYIDWAGYVVSPEIQPEFGTNITTTYRDSIWLPDEERSGSCQPSTAFGEHPSLFQCLIDDENHEPCFLREDGETIVCGYPFEPFIAETITPVDLTDVEDLRIENLWINLLDGPSCTLLAEPLPIADEDSMDVTHQCTDGSYLRGEPRQFPGRELQFAENVVLTEEASTGTILESSLTPISSLTSFTTAFDPCNGCALSRPIPPTFYVTYWQIR